MFAVADPSDVRMPAEVREPAVISLSSAAWSTVASYSAVSEPVAPSGWQTSRNVYALRQRQCPQGRLQDESAAVGQVVRAQRLRRHDGDAGQPSALVGGVDRRFHQQRVLVTAEVGELPEHELLLEAEERLPGGIRTGVIFAGARVVVKRSGATIDGWIVEPRHDVISAVTPAG